jgi:hypothetical protein
MYYARTSKKNKEKSAVWLPASRPSKVKSLAQNDRFSDWPATGR